MALDNIEFAKATVDKFFDVRYGSEKYFEYIGKEAYRALIKLIHGSDVEDFKNFFSTAGCEWKGTIVKLKRKDEIFRDVYVRVCKKSQLVGGEQLWDIELYDIEALTGAYARLGEKSKMYKTLLGFVERSFFRYEHETGNIIFFRIVNGREQKLFSMKLEEWKNEAVYLGHIDKADEDIFLRMCTELENGKKDINADLSTSLYSTSDEIKPCHITGALIARDGKPFMTLGTVGALGLYSADRTAEAEEADIDHLTKLYNKKYIQNKAKGIIENMSMDRFALFIMDVDNFKEVNDSFGHMYGDQVLEKVAAVLSDVIADKGAAGRIGGDEFMGIIYDAKDEEEIRYFMRSIRSRVEYLFADTPGVNVTCSIGAARYPDDCGTYDELFNRADKCLYLAKEKGKNRYIIYNEELHGSIVESEKSQRTAIDHAGSKNDVNVYLVKEAISRLIRDGKDAIEDVLKLAVELRMFDRAAVYFGEGYRLMYSYGDNCSESAAVWAASADYVDRFRGNGVFDASNLFKTEAIDKNVFEEMKGRDTDCYIQAIFGTPDNVRGFTSFECSTGEKRFTEPVINAVCYISKLIEEIIL